MRVLIFTAFIFGFSAFMPLNLAKNSAKAEKMMTIAAVVNEDIVSQTDVEDRLKLLIASSGLQNTREIRERLMPQVISSLVEEQIMMQEAEKQNVEVTEEEILGGFQSIADQNKIPVEQFLKILEAQRIPKRTLENQIEAQISWSKIIQQVLRPQIDISDNDVEARQERFQKLVGETEYLAAEIFIPVGDAEEESNIRQLSNRLVQEIRKGAPFSRIAAQFSKAAGADKGGDLGWVREGQLDESLEATLQSMAVGTVSEPQRTLSGYHILLLRDKRTIEEENLPSRLEIESQIGLERLERLQRQYLSDLKASAFIEERV